MAEKSKTDEKAEAEKPEPKKHVISITNDKGEYAPTPLAECNAMAYGAMTGRKRRERDAVKQVTAAVKAAMRRVG